MRPDLFDESKIIKKNDANQNNTDQNIIENNINQSNVENNDVTNDNTIQNHFVPLKALIYEIILNIVSKYDSYRKLSIELIGLHFISNIFSPSDFIMHGFFIFNVRWQKIFVNL